MKYKLFIFILSIILLDACSAHRRSSQDYRSADTTSVAEKTEMVPAIAPSPTSTLTPATQKVAPEAIVPLSPYSSDGLLVLNEFRSNNIALNDFLLRNRKPDYFFTSANTEFKYQKI